MEIAKRRGYNFTFAAKLGLNAKSALNLQHDKKLLESVSPMDFFYETSKANKVHDGLRWMKDFIRTLQQKDNCSDTKYAFLKKCFSCVTYLELVTNKISMFSKIQRLYESFTIINKNKKSNPNYINTWAILGNSSPDKFVNINLEDEPIEKIAKTNEATIFMMNHDNVNRDRFVYPIVNSFLNYSYATLGLQKECPRPYIIVSKNVVKRAGNTLMRKIYNRMGLVSIDASLKDRNYKDNITPIKNLIERFSNDQANIFIFPEGNNSIYKDKPRSEKFQTGFTKILKEISKSKDTINIVPMGISYSEDKDCMANINIAKTVKLVNRSGYHVLLADNFSSLIGDISNKSNLKFLSDTLADLLEESVKASKNL